MFLTLITHTEAWPSERQGFLSAEAGFCGAEPRFMCTLGTEETKSLNTHPLSTHPRHKIKGETMTAACSYPEKTCTNHPLANPQSKDAWTLLLQPSCLSS